MNSSANMFDIKISLLSLLTILVYYGWYDIVFLIIDNCYKTVDDDCLIYVVSIQCT